MTYLWWALVAVVGLLISMFVLWMLVYVAAGAWTYGQMSQMARFYKEHRARDPEETQR